MSFLYIPWWSQPITGAVTDGVLFINGTTRTVTTNSSLTFDGIDLRLATTGSVYAGQYELLDNAPFIPQYALFRDGISIGFSTEGNQRLYINRSGIISPSGGFTATSANPILNFLGEFNTGSVATGFRLNITDTASAAASLLMDLQVGGVSQFNVGKNGFSVSKGGFRSINSPNLLGFEVYWGASFPVANVTSTDGTGSVTVSGDGAFRFSNAALSVSNPDLFIRRDAANTLAQRNGVNAQTLRVYNTFTDASNYERGVMQWSGNILTIGAEGLGTGAVTPRVVNFIASNSSGSRRVATMRAASQVAMEVVGQGITTPSAGVGTLTVFTQTSGLAEVALDLAYTDGAGSRLGGFRFRDTRTPGDWVACQMEMEQSFGDGNVIQSRLLNQDVAWPGLIFVSQTAAGAALTTSPTFQWRNFATTQLTIDANNNIVCNNAAIATNANNGFLYVPGCAGTPTGTPTAYTGRVPIVVDTTNNKLYFYSGGAWRDAGP